MADQHDAGAHPGQLTLQPLDAGQVQMIGRLVEQQDVGRGSHRTRQRGAARLAAGERRGIAAALEPDLRQERRGPVVGRTVRIGQAGGNVVRHAGMTGEIRFLRQGGHRGAGLGEAVARIVDRLAGQDAQQARLAGAIAADQRQPLARRHREVDAVEDGLVAEVKADAGEGQEGWLGHVGFPGGRLSWPNLSTAARTTVGSMVAHAAGCGGAEAN